MIHVAWVVQNNNTGTDLKRSVPVLYLSIQKPPGEEDPDGKRRRWILFD